MPLCLSGMNTEILPPAPKPIALRTLLTISGLFWVYVTLSNVLYATNMQFSAALFHAADMFAPWEVRVVQHVLLLPVLLTCYWASSRAGWGMLRGVPLQLLLAAIFAVLCYPAMNLAIHLCMWIFQGHWQEPAMPAEPSGAERAAWSASFISFFLTYGFGVALVSGFNWYQLHRDSELRGAALERVWTTARLTALRMQLSPHTLFNLLHTIRGQINPEPEIARSMVVQLADLLRRLLSAGQRDFSLLSEELSFARMYLELQQQRFGDRLTVSLPDADAQPALWVPSLILQPLVENAVLHGLAGHDGPVEIRLEVCPSADRLVMRIVNTTASLAIAAGENIGLGNVRERLAVQFGARASLSSYRAGPTSWVAEITMPALLERAPATPVGGTS
jgi:Histidine kinase